jgi:hypothetical protein
VLFGRLPWGERWAEVLTNCAHGPVSALIAIVVFSILRADESPHAPIYRHWLASIGVTTLLGTLIEAVQFTIGRDAEIGDIITDLLGAIAGTGLYVYISGRAAQDRLSRAARAAGLLCAVVAIGVIAAPVVTMAAAYVARNVRFPVLMDGDSLLGSYFMTPYWIETQREKLPRLPGAATGPRTGYKVRLGAEDDWGLGLAEALPDWRERNSLIIELLNPAAESLALRVRVYDKAHGLIGRHGFITSATLKPRARTRWQIPLQEIRQAHDTQHINLAEVSGLVLYGPGNGSKEFFVLNIRLE